MFTTIKKRNMTFGVTLTMRKIKTVAALLAICACVAHATKVGVKSLQEGDYVVVTYKSNGEVTASGTIKVATNTGIRIKEHKGIFFSALFFNYNTGSSVTHSKAEKHATLHAICVCVAHGTSTGSQPMQSTVQRRVSQTSVSAEKLGREAFWRNVHVLASQRIKRARADTTSIKSDELVRAKGLAQLLKKTELDGIAFEKARKREWENKTGATPSTWKNPGKKSAAPKKETIYQLICSERDNCVRRRLPRFNGRKWKNMGGDKPCHMCRLHYNSVIRL